MNKETDLVIKSLILLLVFIIQHRIASCRKPDIRKRSFYGCCFFFLKQHNYCISYFQTAFIRHGIIKWSCYEEESCINFYISIWENSKAAAFAFTLGAAQYSRLFCKCVSTFLYISKTATSTSSSSFGCITFL
jgi:hypothetical protein